ncbi:hypothetical protein D3C77_414190 [compost metagenome]
MVRADEARSLALFVFAHGGAAVAATVEQHVDVLLAITHHNHRLLADVGGLVVAGFWHFTFVSDPDPGAVEDFLEFGVKQCRVGVQRRVDTISLHQIGRVDRQVYSGNQIAHGISLPGQIPANLYQQLQVRTATVGPCFCKYGIR